MQGGDEENAGGCDSINGGSVTELELYDAAVGAENQDPETGSATPRYAGSFWILGPSARHRGCDVM
ncbi:hypothetical protein VF21_09680 [Pseudogymnoascus sp. 05NY08]|nr:hypothetical protein VF21_09680 [Pseudogymnoascus sp. 05NY08]